MLLEIFTPEEHLGELIADLNGRSGRISSVEESYGGKVITGYAPMRAIFGYAHVLRSMTRGRASFTTRFSEYRRSPLTVQEKIVERVKTGCG